VENDNSVSGTKLVPQLVTASDLEKKRESLVRSRQLLDSQWKINLAFYKGKQYVYYNRDSRRLESLPVDDGDKPRWRVRLVSNQIMPNTHALLAQLIKTKPVMTASPGSGSDHDVKAAQLAEHLLEYWWDEFNLTDKLEEALLWALICGQGYWKITWDPYAAKSMRFTLDPEGNPITDDTLKDAFRAQLAQFGIDPMEKVVYMGDIKVEVMSPFTVFPEPCRNFNESTYVLCDHYLTPDYIQARWGVLPKPDSVSANPDEMLPFGNAEDRAEPTLKRVTIGYFKPTASLPNGRYVVWMDQPKQILEDGPWPYPTHDLPIVKFSGIKIPGSIYDSSVVEHAIPLQKELNRTLSQIIEYKNLTIKPRIWAPMGSLRQRLTTEPGAVYEYSPVGGLKPEVEALPTMPSYVFDHLSEINSRLKEMFFMSEVAEGSLPPNVEAGIAIDLLQEMSTDKISPTIQMIEQSIETAGRLMLILSQQYYIEPRFLKIKGSGGGYQVRRFTQTDLTGEVSINVESGSGLPRTRAGRLARIIQYMQMGVINPEESWRYIDTADTKSIAAKWLVDEDQSNREHEKILQKTPLNPESINEAMGYIQVGINPETGQPLEGPEEADMVLRRAALRPGIADIHPVHADVHGRFIKSVEFEALPPDIRYDFILHYQLTLEALQGLPQPEPQAPKINLQLKSTVGPTAQSKILQSAGVDVSAEESSEPPLETWVNDSIDKPDTDDTGPGQEGAKNAQILHDMLLKEHQSQESSRIAREKHEASMAREQESTRRAKADADTAEKKSRQSDFRKTESKDK
jgi:hypothetical protein